MGWLQKVNRRFGKQPEVKAATRLGSSLGIPRASTHSQTAKRLQVDFLSITKWAYRGNELVHSCMDERSRALKEAPLRIFDEGNDEWAKGNPVESLLRHPNPFRDEAELLETIEQHLSLTGNAFVRKVRDKGGKVRELWPMQPHLVKIVPDRVTYIKKYIYTVEGREYDLKPEDVIHLLYIDPADDFYGLSPLVAAARRIDADTELGKFTKQLLLNMAVTSGCFVTDKKLNPEERQIMEDKMASRYVGAVRAGLPMVLSHGMKWEQTSMTMKDLEIGNIAAILESRICLALHVPAIVVGAKVGLDRSTFTNVREAREYMYENTISPEWKMIADKLGGSLLVDFGYDHDSGLEARFDTSKIRALTESEHELWTRVESADSLSIIEKRLKLGYPAEPQGAVFLDANRVSVNIKTGEMSLRANERAAAGVDDDKDGNPQGGNGQGQKKNDGLDTKDLDGIPTEDQRAALLNRLINIEERHHPLIKAAAVGMFEDMAYTITNFLDQEGIKASIVSVRPLRPEIERIVRRNLRGNILEVVKEGAEGTRAVLGTSFGLTNDEAVKFASKHTSVLAGEIAENSLDTVQGIISEGLAEGAPLKDVRLRLEEKFTEWSSSRAETVARTETLRASNMGSLESLRKGGVEYKQWIAASDACDTCLALHEEVYPTGEDFMSKGDTVVTPGTHLENDYMHIPTPPIHPRCRCTIGGIPGSMVQEETATVKKIGSRSADTDELLRKFSQLDPAKEFTHLRQPLHQMSLSRAVENDTAQVILRRYGDKMSIILKDSGTILPTAENWAGQVGHLAYGDTYTWLTTAKEAGRLSIRHLADDAGSLISLSGRANQGAMSQGTLINFSSATDAANRSGWVSKLGTLSDKYPDPAKLLSKVGDAPLEEGSDAVAQTGWVGSKRKINFNTQYNHTELNGMFRAAQEKGYTTISGADDVATHEFGHVVDGYLKNKGINTEVLRTSREKFISDYATRNAREYFAEVFTAYERGGDLSRYDIRMMKHLLEEGGLQ